MNVKSKINNDSSIPVVLWHGMGDVGDNPLSMGFLEFLIHQVHPSQFIYSVMVGNTTDDDELADFIGLVPDQIRIVRDKIRAIPQLANGFHAVGLSQGGQFLRGYVEMFNDPPVINLVTLGGQHMGVYGIPDCNAPDYTICEWVRELMDVGVYDSYVQSTLVQAQYYNDPLDQAAYQAYSLFIADINNQKPVKNPAYKQRLTQLNKFVMVQFLNDTVVIPMESEFFEFYVPGQDDVIQPLAESDLSVQDFIGLKVLNESNRLIFLSTEGNHLKFTPEWFRTQIVEPFLS